MDATGEGASPPELAAVAVDCSALSQAQLHGLLLVSTDASGPEKPTPDQLHGFLVNPAAGDGEDRADKQEQPLPGLMLQSPGGEELKQREELDLGDVAYMDGEALSLPLAAASGGVNCSILMNYLTRKPTASLPLVPPPSLSDEKSLREEAIPSSDPDDPEPLNHQSLTLKVADVAEETSQHPSPPRDLSRTCLICGVLATETHSRPLRGDGPLSASGTYLLSLVDSLLSSELTLDSLAKLERVCLDCYQLLVNLDELQHRVAQLQQTLRAQFRSWWRTKESGEVAEARSARRRSTRRAAAACADAAAREAAQLSGDLTDDEYQPAKRRKRAPPVASAKTRAARRGRFAKVDHAAKVESSKNLVCAVCPFYTFDKEALSAHIEAVHAGEKTHQCGVCQKRFTYEDSLKRHMTQHQHFIREFRCEVPLRQPCGEQFVKREDLLLHRQLYLHGAQAPLPPPPALRASDLEEFAIQFCCPGCNLPLTVQDCQADVAVTCGCGRQFDMADVLKLFPGKYPPRCLLCDESCEDHDAMETHLNERHAAGELVCLLCKCRYKKLDHFKLHSLFHATLQELTCDKPDCAFRTFSPAVLAAHSHAEELAVPATAAAAAADDPPDQEAIVSAVRNNVSSRRGRPRKDGPRPPPTETVCPICGKELTTLTNLKNHMVLHSDVHAHTCSVCGRRFKLQKYLTTHLALHTGVRKYKCTLCEKDFNQKCELNRHMRYHNGDMKHVCEFCGRRFREANGLKFHRQVHTGERPFQCTQCGMALRSAAKLRIHQRKHTGEKPYKCEYCGKDFAYKYNFDCHLRLHTGDRRFRCSICQMGFERRDKLAAHELGCSKRMEAAVPTQPPSAAPENLAPPAVQQAQYVWSMDELVAQ